MSKLPKPIEEFFRLKNAEDDEGLAQLFTEDATVIDAGERNEMRGRAEITRWIEKSISGLHLQTDVRGCASLRRRRRKVVRGCKLLKSRPLSRSC